MTCRVKARILTRRTANSGTYSDSSAPDDFSRFKNGMLGTKKYSPPFIFTRLCWLKDVDVAFFMGLGRGDWGMSDSSIVRQPDLSRCSAPDGHCC